MLLEYFNSDEFKSLSNKAYLKVVLSLFFYLSFMLNLSTVWGMAVWVGLHTLPIVSVVFLLLNVFLMGNKVSQENVKEKEISLTHPMESIMFNSSIPFLFEPIYKTYFLNLLKSNSGDKFMKEGSLMLISDSGKALMLSGKALMLISDSEKESWHKAFMFLIKQMSTFCASVLEDFGTNFFISHMNTGVESLINSGIGYSEVCETLLLLKCMLGFQNHLGLELFLQPKVFCSFLEYELLYFKEGCNYNFIDIFPDKDLKDPTVSWFLKFSGKLFIPANVAPFFGKYVLDSKDFGMFSSSVFLHLTVGADQIGDMTHLNLVKHCLYVFKAPDPIFLSHYFYKMHSCAIYLGPSEIVGCPIGTLLSINICILFLTEHEYALDMFSPASIVFFSATMHKLMGVLDVGGLGQLKSVGEDMDIPSNLELYGGIKVPLNKDYWTSGGTQPIMAFKESEKTKPLSSWDKEMGKSSKDKKSGKNMGYTYTNKMESAVTAAFSEDKDFQPEHGFYSSKPNLYQDQMEHPWMGGCFYFGVMSKGGEVEYEEYTNGKPEDYPPLSSFEPIPMTYKVLFHPGWCCSSVYLLVNVKEEEEEEEEEEAEEEKKVKSKEELEEEEKKKKEKEEKKKEEEEKKEKVVVGKMTVKGKIKKNKECSCLKIGSMVDSTCLMSGVEKYYHSPNGVVELDYPVIQGLESPMEVSKK